MRCVSFMDESAIYELDKLFSGFNLGVLCSGRTSSFFDELTRELPVVELSVLKNNVNLLMGDLSSRDVRMFASMLCGRHNVLGLSDGVRFLFIDVINESPRVSVGYVLIEPGSGGMRVSGARSEVDAPTLFSAVAPVSDSS